MSSVLRATKNVEFIMEEVGLDYYYYYYYYYYFFPFELMNLVLWQIQNHRLYREIFWESGSSPFILIEKALFYDI